MFSFQFSHSIIHKRLNQTFLCDQSPINRFYSTLSSLHKRRVLSGIQPTGEPHIGNYLGAIKNWKRLQDIAKGPDENIFMIVDMHSITTETDRKNLENSTRAAAATFLACGLDPDKSIIYNQSRVPGHAELTWILLCLSPMYELKTMTQYKDKVKKQSEPLAGLLSYPVLMAADILLFRATEVPVGDDQVQHLELCRKLGSRFNRVFGEPSGIPDFFPVPQTLHTEAPRVMSLRDASKKMSKSDPSDFSRIQLSDSPELIRSKIQKAKTDSILGISYDTINRPEIANLIHIYSAFSGLSYEEIALRHQSHDILQFKNHLSEVLLSTLAPISQNIAKYQNDPTTITKVLADGAKRANGQAEETMSQIRKLVGYF